MLEPATLLVKLDGAEVTRTIQIKTNDSLYNLAFAICRAFEFNFDHAFGFYSETRSHNYFKSKTKYELFADMGDGTEGAFSVKKSAVEGAFPKVGGKMRFVFDYGDEWHFIVTRQKAAPLEPKTKLPKVIASQGKAPEQYPDMDEC